ncbi:hypothetical protein V6R21_00395 [Limibacter armeniacum]|uniref:hypothetical protein n=1 Tax=Limibacter armeniacum TaxID=466084 RepID=UPI002FE52DC9
MSTPIYNTHQYDIQNDLLITNSLKPATSKAIRLQEEDIMKGWILRYCPKRWLLDISQANIDSSPNSIIKDDSRWHTFIRSSSIEKIAYVTGTNPSPQKYVQQTIKEHDIKEVKRVQLGNFENKEQALEWLLQP